jgi:hypothetical protein
MAYKWYQWLSWGGITTFVFGLILFQFIVLNEDRSLDNVVSFGMGFMALGGGLMVVGRAFR